MLTWNERPFEIAHLLNPAFCSLLIRETTYSFTDEGQDGLPYTLSFLILPIVLHQVTRNALPERANMRMFDWFERNPQLKGGFADRARRLVPYTRESLIFGVQKGILQVDVVGNFHSVGEPLQPSGWPNTSEPSVCRGRARFLGRWFAQTGDVKSIFRLWGVRP